MSGRGIHSYQKRAYMNGRELGLKQKEAAYIAGISERTGQRIERGKHRPNLGKPIEKVNPRDPLKGKWEEELEPMLAREPKLKAMTLYEYLQEKYPGEYGQVLRTLQRRVKAWKVLYGPSPEVMFEIRHEPGMMGISDFTKLKGVNITIQGEPFEHLIYHYRLTYSGWQYAQIIQGGESFVALSEGLQNALQACGGSPKQHRTDSLSAAYRNLSGKRHKPLTRLYDELCDHYRLEPTHNNPGKGHENGAIESPHGHLKNRIQQAIYLRGSADFETIDEYQQLITTATEKLNRQHEPKIADEKAVLQPLPQYRVADYEILTAKVSNRSTIEVRCILYTVPSRLIGQRVELHLHHDRIIGYWGKTQVFSLPRKRVKETGKRRGRSINYRHVIDGLRKKPRAFLYCTWQNDLLPNDRYRQLWTAVQERYERDHAAVLMVEVLVFAASHGEDPVADYVEQELATHSLTKKRLQRQFPPLHLAAVPDLAVEQHSLHSYDQLLYGRNETEQSDPEPLPTTHHSAPADAPILASASLGEYRSPGSRRTMVLCPILADSLRVGGSAPWRCSTAATSARGPTPHW